MDIYYPSYLVSEEKENTYGIELNSDYNIIASHGCPTLEEAWQDFEDRVNDRFIIESFFKHPDESIARESNHPFVRKYALIDDLVYVYSLEGAFLSLDDWENIYTISIEEMAKILRLKHVESLTDALEAMCECRSLSQYFREFRNVKIWEGKISRIKKHIPEIKRIFSKCSEINKSYPNSDLWIEKVVKENREVIVALANKKVVGLSILKKNKICTLYVKKEYRGIKLGTSLLWKAITFLNKKAIITVSEDNNKSFESLLINNGFHLEKTIEGIYNTKKVECFYKREKEIK